VQVAGRTVGSIQELRLTDDGQAEVVMKITDDELQPLHRGTRAEIRAVGLSSVANRYVELSPGPETAPEIENGGVLTQDETHGIVDLDALLDALDPRTRGLLQSIIRDASKIYAGSAEQANTAFRYLNPALTQTAALGRELAADEAALERLVVSASDAVTAVAARRDELGAAVEGTAGTLSAVASERAALEDALARAPAVLTQAEGTLRRTRGTLEVVRPALREARPSAPPLARLLRRLVPTSQRAIPVLADLRALLPGVRDTLQPLPGLARVALPALGSTTRALRDALPIFAGLRPYAPELATGLFNGFGWATGGHYDANGHFARISAQGGLVGLTGPLAVPGFTTPGTGEARTGLTARCPGAAVEPAPDGSNPYIPDQSLCNPEHGRR
jgi:phospholipid/cholesterol/gamma-HCH transport system substrate-binding protein